MALRGKLQAYAEARAQGLKPIDAAAQAGYAPGPSMKVCASIAEKRADVQAEILRLKRGGKTEGAEDEGVEEAGRDAWKMKDSYKSPLDLLRDVWNNPQAPKALRYQAAKDALPYCHARMEGGKKKDAEETAREKSNPGNKYAPGTQPTRLRAVN